MLYAIIFLSFAAFFSACMDKMWNHFSSSVFPKFALFCFRAGLFSSEEKALDWFDAKESWRNIYIDRKKENGRIVVFKIFGFKYYKPSWISDGWHFSKLLMILSISSAFSILAPIVKIDIVWLSYLISVNIYAIIWGIVFETFFSKVLNA